MKVEKNRIIEYFIYLFVFLLPLQTVWIINEGFIYGFKWHQGTYLLYLTEVLLWGVFLFSVLPLKKINFSRINKKRFLTVGLVWFLAIFAGLSILLSGEKTVALYWWYKVLAGTALFFLVLNAKIDFKKVSIAFVLSGVLQSFLAIWQFFSQEVVASKWLGMSLHLPSEITASVVGSGGDRWLRAYGSFSHPNVLGGFLAICFVFALSLYFTTRPSWQKVVGAASVIFISVGLFFSFSRSAILAALLAYFVWLFLLLWKKRYLEITKLSVYLLVLASVLFMIYSPLVQTRITSSDPLEEKSTKQRIDSLSEARDIFLDRPLTGVGIGNYTSYLLKTKPGFEGWHYQPAHNIYLMVLAELGVIGLLLFLAIIVSAFLHTANAPTSFSLLLILSVIGLFDHYLWTSYFGLLLFYLVLALAFRNLSINNIFEKIINKTRLELGYITGKNFYAPDYVSLVTTFSCNFRCQTCDIWKKENLDELDKVEWLMLSDKLKKELKPNTFVEINGGEALLKKDSVVDLVENLKDHFVTVVLNTNGSTITSGAVSELKSVGLDKIKLSLYSLDSGVHNFLRGTDIAYDNARGAIDIIIESGIDLEVGILITSKNILQVPQLIEYVNTISGAKVIIQPLDEVVESLSSKDMSSTDLLLGLWPSSESVKGLFRWLKDNPNGIKNSSANLLAIEEYYLNPESTLRYRCFAGQRNLVIYPNGDVAMCFKGGVIGNLKNGTISSILKGATLERKKIANCQKYCRVIGCNFTPLNNFKSLQEYLVKKNK